MSASNIENRRCRVFSVTALLLCRYGGWSLSHTKENPLFIVWYNNKGHHSMPAYLNALNEAILRATGVQGHLTTLNHPLKLSSEQLNRMTM
jgi:hypothetical protein